MRPILLKGHDGPLTCVKYNKDGDLLFTTCRRGRINLWYSDDGERMGTYNSGAKPGAVMYVDVNCERPPCDPPLLAPTASYPCPARRSPLPLPAARRPPPVLDFPGGRPPLRARGVRRSAADVSVTASCFLRPVACTRLASASMDQTARIWDVETGKKLQEYELQAGARCVSFSSGDKMLAVVQDPFQDQTSCIKIFDTTSGSKEPIKKIDTDYGLPKINRALFGPLNKRLIVCNEGGGLLGYDVATGECEIERCDNEEEIPDFTFAADQMTFIVGCKDHTSTLYDTVTMEPIKKYETDRPINSAAISPLMDHVVLGGGQDAAAVTTTAGRSGKFEVRVFPAACVCVCVCVCVAQHIVFV